MTKEQIVVYINVNVRYNKPIPFLVSDEKQTEDEETGIGQFEKCVFVECLLAGKRL